MIAVRRANVAFGRGALSFLYPANRKVLAYLRETESERILCVVNVSRAPQAVELDLAEFKGAAPFELTAGSLFPPIGATPYVLTLPAYGFFWFRLEPALEVRHAQTPLPELFTLVAIGKIESIFTGRELIAFERNVAPQFLSARRWFHAQAGLLPSVSVRDFAVLRTGDDERRFVLPLLDVRAAGSVTETYFTPLVAERESEKTPQPPASSAVAKLRRVAEMGVLYDADACPPFGAAMLEAFRSCAELKTAKGGKVVFSPLRPSNSALEIDAAEIQPLNAARRHSTLVLDKRLALKIYHRLEAGEHPEVEIERFLNEVAKFPNTPPLLGVVDYCDATGARRTLAALRRFVRCQGDAWTWTLEALKRILEALAMAPAQSNHGDEPAPASFSTYAPHMKRLGMRTAEMHLALATPTEDPAFKTEPLTHSDVRASVARLREAGARGFQLLKGLALGGASPAVERLLGRCDECFGLINALEKEPLGAIKIRIHGDYRLGRALVVKDDVIIVGFDGGAGHGDGDPRAKTSPLRDVATMLRSFAHVVAAAERSIAELVPDPAAAASRLSQELVEFSEIFVKSYMGATQGGPIWIEDLGTRRRLLILYLLDAAFEELVVGTDSASAIETTAKVVNGVLDRAARPGYAGFGATPSYL